MGMATCHSKLSSESNSESERPSLEEEEEAEEQEDEDDEGQLQHDLVRINLGISITTVCIASCMFDIRLRLSNTYKICNACQSKTSETLVKTSSYSYYILSGSLFCKQQSSKKA